MTTTTPTAQPTVDQVMAGMSAGLGGKAVPPMIQLTATVMPDMVLRQAQDSGFAMPKEGGALAEETRTILLLGIALATGNDCVENLVNKAKAQGIDDDKLLETLKIARFAEATRVFNNAVPLLAQLTGK
ncbi:MAG: carboxymuconolactone decarboxylase family protein [Phycicoccus sp.]|nr:carboxymuconolactone decarboxylase family protein [Phycicoccus sp.]